MMFRFVVLCLTLMVSAAHAEIHGLETPPDYYFVAFPVATGHTVAGRLSVPVTEREKKPAVVIVHGSGGVDSRGPAYAQKLNELGIATLEIDMWSARSMSGGLDRPKHVKNTLPDAKAAFRYLASRPEIDANRIGLMGFSWGGVVGMLTASGQVAGFESVAALYPVCWGYNEVPGYEFRQVAVKEVLLISGTRDQYDRPDDCESLVSSLPEPDRERVTEVSLVGATHAFDRAGPPAEFFDPYAFRGKGGEVRIEHDVTATKRSLYEVGQFFKRTLTQRTLPLNDRDG
ncbi:hypothetical protein DYI22_01455 [Marinobacter lipolyticus]|uniref:dienelactone hydrolase family protein n=1 Tax=Marinobacter lipolyticus TaxID=209639 RepID=UPI001BCE5D9C|nr:dienelactone hydrolase family protein [Marinobacter lipolyticus]MBS8239168.1 hypothetical protein [Marinobacter lipolyticus]